MTASKEYVFWIAYAAFMILVLAVVLMLG